MRALDGHAGLQRLGEVVRQARRAERVAAAVKLDGLAWQAAAELADGDVCRGEVRGDGSMWWLGALGGVAGNEHEREARVWHERDAVAGAKRGGGAAREVPPIDLAADE
jgi:hypothetical protein